MDFFGHVCFRSDQFLPEVAQMRSRHDFKAPLPRDHCQGSSSESIPESHWQQNPASRIQFPAKGAPQ